jgi:predicted ATP-grasp superfamily ATP-dependent carboligase
MAEILEIWETPQAKEVYLLAGWRQWADAGSISSRLPLYLIEQLKARQVGKISNDGFYLFQIPGTHDVLRPLVRYEEGYPLQLDAPSNDLYYSGDENLGILIFSGDEPHMNIERYISAFLQIVQAFKVRRIISFGGVYGEVPYNKERSISASYSMPHMKKEAQRLGVALSQYQGGASIDSVICKRAGEADVEHITLYAFVPSYDFSSISDQVNAIRIENDFTAWLGILRRVNAMLNLNLDLYELEIRSAQLIEAIEAKIDELEQENPGMGVREYMNKLIEDYDEPVFNPTDNFWEEKLRGLFDKIDPPDE